MRTFRRPVLHAQVGGSGAWPNLNLPAVELGVFDVVHIFGRELVVALSCAAESSASVRQVEQLLHSERFYAAPDCPQMRAELRRHTVPLQERLFVQQFLVK